ncbi:hypothetical protein NC652_014364 [Populus alba x Populus x berolinensis]|nr:hypothetical protein NC652_014364 [Populus alba x Populus x berolinensis]
MDLNAQAQLSALVVAVLNAHAGPPALLNPTPDILTSPSNLSSHLPRKQKTSLSSSLAKKGLFTELKSCGRVTLILAWFTQITTSKQSVFLLLLLLVLCSSGLIEPCQYLSTLSCLSRSISKNTIPLEQLMEKILRVFSSMT